jgi:hypothetical protein
MVVNKLQNGLIKSSIAPKASRLNCQIFFSKFEHVATFFFILIEIFILKTTIHHKYTLTHQKYKKKNYYRLFLGDTLYIF